VREEHRDVGMTSLIEKGINETKRRAWLLFEVGCRGSAGKD